MGLYQALEPAKQLVMDVVNKVNNVSSVKIIENGVLVVGVRGINGSYLMWQRGLTEDVGSNDGVYFERDDQSQGGYNIVLQCRVSTKDICLVYVNGESVNFRFPPEFDGHQELKEGLLEIYDGVENILQFEDQSQNCQP